MGNLGQSYLYDNDVTIVKQLGDSRLKVINMSVCRISGLEPDGFIEYTKKNSVNSEKLSNNVARAKTKINELALCNPWSWFVTLTIDKDKYDRYDLKTYYKHFSQFLNNLNRKRIFVNPRATSRRRVAYARTVSRIDRIRFIQKCKRLFRVESI